METLATGSGQFGEGLVKALGLEKRRVKEIHIHAYGDAIIIVDVIEYLRADDGETLLQHLSLYRLESR